MPLYRTGAGTNVLQVGVGTPEVLLNLTCSTNVDFLMVTTTDCDGCVLNSPLFTTQDSSSLTTSLQALTHTFIYPIGSSNTLSIGSQLAEEILTDERGETTARPIALATKVQANDPNSRLDGNDVTLPDGTSGFWGLGVYQSTKSDSMIPSMIETNGDGSPSTVTSFTVGLDIANTTTRDGSAGTIHWGAVPDGSYVGDFNWLNANTSVAGSWGFGLDRLRVSNDVIDLSNLYGSIDPAFDQIYVPTSVAESFFAKVPDSQRDLGDTTRWNIPCDTHIDLLITIDDRQYAVDPSRLVQARDAQGRTCWSSVVAWQNGSLPEQRGEVRLGTPFLSGVYAALYYSSTAQYIGLAGKPEAINGANLAPQSDGHRNAKLAGILIGVLLGVLILLLLLCYSRNRNSFQSIWYRAIRRQQRAQMNMIVRGATLPPPPPPMMVSIPGPGVLPPMMGPPLPMRPMPMVPPSTMMGRMFGPGQGQGYGYQPVPPPYQPPMNREPNMVGNYQAAQQQPLLHNQQHSSNPAPMPQVVEHRPQGYYSPRLQPTSPSRTEGHFQPLRQQNQYHVPPTANPQPHQGQHLYDAPPPPSSRGAGGPRVKWGGIGARHTRSAGSSDRSMNDFGMMEPAHGGRSGPDGRKVRHEQLMGHYAPSQAEQSSSGAAGRNEKKRYFAWRPSQGGDSEKGEYRAVVASPRSGGGVGKSEKRRSWFGGGGGGNRSKDGERERADWDGEARGEWMS
nr:uncharacterized protein CI109_003719 [Kwoniella shandongensis]KAA5528064.1 hypothetical protein CI109_003719 [Kwoniella shandongensis]